MILDMLGRLGLNATTIGALSSSLDLGVFSRAMLLGICLTMSIFSSTKRWSYPLLMLTKWPLRAMVLL